MASNKTYTLYGTEFSLYTGKARSYLRYKGVPYREVLSTFRVYRRVILPHTGVPMIPVVATPSGRHIQDTTEIIDALELRFPGRPVYPESPAQRLAALLFELLGDEWLLLPAMHYRWNYPQQNQAFLEADFGRIIAPWAPTALRRLLGRRLARRFAGMLPMLGIDPVTAPAIESWYEEFLGQLDAHFARHPYLFGGRASIGDFGLMGPLYAHLYRDPAPGRLMRERAPNVVDWLERMNRPLPEIGDWLPDDTVPDTLIPILRRQFEEQFPVLEDTALAVANWIEAHPGKRIPRRIGSHAFRIGDSQGKRAILPFAVWMAQRPLDFYRGLAGEDRAAADRLLTRAAGTSAMAMPVPRRLERRENRLVAAAGT